MTTQQENEPFCQKYIISSMKHILPLFLSLFFTMAVNGKTGREIIEENGFPKYVTPKLKTEWSQTELRILCCL